MDMLSKTLIKTKVFMDSINNPYSTYFNTPVKFIKNDWYVNERIVEIPFVHRHIDLDGDGKIALEFGCTRSELAIQLASLGYKVYGIDLRPYQITHPNFHFYQGNILDFNKNIKFDLITSVSVLEHIGLGAYGETEGSDILNKISNKLVEWLKPGGKLLITVPVGIAYQDKFLQSFSYKDFISLFSQPELILEEELFFSRTEFKYWKPNDLRNAGKFSNKIEDRGPTGVNFVGCFAWRKKFLQSRNLKK